MTKVGGSHILRVNQMFLISDLGLVGVEVLFLADGDGSWL
jgi:hypothetical protein